jgi:hypothetical protein
MEISRVITYPSTVEKQSNTTVVLIDASVEEVENIARFCQVSNQNYDVYLYKQDLNDLQWLDTIIQLADHTLISQSSLVTVDNVDQISKFGIEQQLNTPLAYFQQVDNI